MASGTGSVSISLNRIQPFVKRWRGEDAQVIEKPQAMMVGYIAPDGWFF